MILNRNLRSAPPAEPRPAASCGRGSRRPRARFAGALLGLGALGAVGAPPLVADETPRPIRPEHPCGADSLLERQAWLMGAPLRIAVDAAERADGLRATEAAFAEVRRLEGLLSTWDASAEMARLNAAPAGEVVAVSPELFGVLVDAERWAAEMGRAFEPAVGPLVDAWDLRGEGRRPTGAELDTALAALRAGVALLAEGPALRRAHPAAWIDTGGFGKGAALAAAGAALRAAGVERATLDFGGQVLAIGAPEGEDGWPVDVAHPRERQRAVATLRVHDASVATSGASERFIEVDGERLGHLLDPRSGQPAPAWGSVTVVAADPLRADVLSTALYVMGPEKALAWAHERTDVGVLLLEDGPRGLAPRWNGAMETWLRAGPPAPTEARAVNVKP